MTIQAGELLSESLVGLALRAALSAGELLLRGPAGELEVQTKTTRTDVVTQMDVEAEALILSVLLRDRPDDGILGEEGGERTGTSGVRWIIDPLDGTVNYLYDLPGWAVSIAAEVAGVVEIGVVAVPSRGETFVARRGHGAWLLGAAAATGVDGDPTESGLRLRRDDGPADLSQALVATGFGYAAFRRTGQARTLARVLPAVRDIRRLGAAAVDLCHAATGRVDCYYERGIQPWDGAAGVLVAREAGLVVGGPFGETSPGTDGPPVSAVSAAASDPSEDLTWVAPPSLAEDFAALLRNAGADRD